MELEDLKPEFSAIGSDNAYITPEIKIESIDQVLGQSSDRNLLHTQSKQFIQPDSSLMLLTTSHPNPLCESQGSSAAVSAIDEQQFCNVSSNQNNASTVDDSIILHIVPLDDQESTIAGSSMAGVCEDQNEQSANEISNVVVVCEDVNESSCAVVQNTTDDYCPELMDPINFEGLSLAELQAKLVGAVRRCTKCGLPVKGHPLPRGEKCNQIPDRRLLKMLENDGKCRMQIRKFHQRSFSKTETYLAHIRRRNRRIALRKAREKNTLQGILLRNTTATKEKRSKNKLNIFAKTLTAPNRCTHCGLQYKGHALPEGVICDQVPDWLLLELWETERDAEKKKKHKKRF